MRMFLIDDKVRSDIKALIEHAHAHPVTIDPDAILSNPKSHVIVGDDPRHVIHIEHGYRVVFSFEKQPKGLCRHLSVSVDAIDDLPNPYVVEELIKLFGFKRELFDCHIGMEQVSATQNAISIVELID